MSGAKCRKVFKETAQFPCYKKDHLSKNFHSDGAKMISYHSLDELDVLTDEQLDVKRDRFVQQGLKNLNLLKNSTARPIDTSGKLLERQYRLCELAEKKYKFWCELEDEFGPCCRPTNSKANFTTHQRQHAQIHECKCGNSFSAFDLERPAKTLTICKNNHQKGFRTTKSGHKINATGQRCTEIEEATGRQCSFTSNRNHSHKSLETCNDCHATFSAFDHSLPYDALDRHMEDHNKVDHRIQKLLGQKLVEPEQYAQCPKCNVEFFYCATGHTSLDAIKQREIHLAKNCFIFNKPVVYQLFTIVDSRFFPVDPSNPIRNFVPVYSGKSLNTIFRMLDEFAVLYRHYLFGDPKSPFAQTYENIMVNGPGLCVTLVDEHLVGSDKKAEIDRIENCEDQREYLRN